MRGSGSMGKRIGGVAAVLALLLLGWPQPAVAGMGSTEAENRCYIDTGRVQLTFDDSADVARVNGILDILKARGVRAGFFVIGRWASSHPATMARIRAEGHWLGNHTASHSNLPRLSDGRMRGEIGGGVAGDRGLLRPPYGALNNRVRQVAASMGYRLCLWTVDTRDWDGASASVIQRRVFDNVRPGAMVLMHLHGRHTPEALPGLIDGIRGRGLELEPLPPPWTAVTVDRTSDSGIWADATGNLVAEHSQADQGSTAKMQWRTAPIVTVAASPRGRGYWMVGADGGVFNFGQAEFHGSAANFRLNRPVVGMAATPTGRGYWLVAADGGVFAFGDAPFLGSAATFQLNQPIVNVASSPTGNGYWLVAADGGVFAYGDAAFYGSAASIRLNQPVTAIAATASGDGYWLLGRDGGVFAYGGAPFRGAYQGPARSDGSPRAFLGISPTPSGYRLLADRPGDSYRFG